MAINRRQGASMGRIAHEGTGGQRLSTPLPAEGTPFEQRGAIAERLRFLGHVHDRLALDMSAAANRGEHVVSLGDFVEDEHFRFPSGAEFDAETDTFSSHWLISDELYARVQLAHLLGRVDFFCDRTPTKRTKAMFHGRLTFLEDAPPTLT